MAEVTVKMVLTGGRAGQTCTIMKWYRFVNGECTLRGEEVGIAGTIRYLGRAYKAFPEGSTELAQHQKLDKEAQHGQRDVQAGAHGHDHHPLQPGVSADGSSAGGEASALGAGAAGAPAGEVRGVPDGSGRSDVGYAEPIRRALAQLDPYNDSHWTKDGHPSIAVLQELVGKEVPYLRREMVNEVAPEARRPE